MGPKTVILCDSKESVQKVFGSGRLEKLKRLVTLHPGIISGRDFNKYKDTMTGCEYIFSTWGMPILDEAQIKSMKSLKAVFYAAGSVRHFAGPYLKRGIKVISAWAENAKPTAAFAFAQALLSCKGYFRHSREYKIRKTGIWSITKEGIYGNNIGILGAGKVGRRLIEMLGPFGTCILVYDPYLTAAQAKQLGVKKTAIGEVFKRCAVVSNHMPDISETRGMLNAELFGSMAKNATFINSGRGAQVNEAGLAKVLRKRKDLTALLDVTCPEPPKKNSPLFKLPNVIISPHIAGAYGKEQVLLADCAIGECAIMMAGRKSKYEITPKMLKTLG